MSGFFYIILIYIFIIHKINKIQSDTDAKITYTPPGNTKYPHGDEYLINADIASADINRVGRIEYYLVKGSKN